MIAIETIVSLLQKALGEEVVMEVEEGGLQPIVQIQPYRVADICLLLHDHEDLLFDSLSCITGIDNGADSDSLDVMYNLYSIPNETALMLKATLPKSAPAIPTLSFIWGCANWLERETYDLVGVEFEDHPDPRRILLPADWEGHPLRKDYQHQEKYHGIKVSY
ncbi:NADH-quinone oxidoreductase subunit C [Flammeovirgaceae bacterium SG7u.111]|nr:NADH-quinone oxidoreductase subunit C [Flammeovirgaceae bacterium SG7u.132]WPO35033.1 NADH-quinone oxidoreductase subunit C [Flammeovirgaceae bacterium SG7u.111]